jgi:hypothetical protein
MLLNKGAKVDVVDLTGRTPMILAVTEYCDLVDSLYMEELEIDEGETTTISKEINHFACIPLLLNHKANVNCMDQDRNTPIRIHETYTLMLT